MTTERDDIDHRGKEIIERSLISTLGKWSIPFFFLKEELISERLRQYIEKVSVKPTHLA
jgi:hypothetical protein